MSSILTFGAIFLIALGVVAVSAFFRAVRGWPLPDRYMACLALAAGLAAIVSGAGYLLADSTRSASIVATIAWGAFTPTAIAATIAYARAKRQVAG